VKPQFEYTPNNAGTSLPAGMHELTTHFENNMLGKIFSSVICSFKSREGGSAVVTSMTSCPPECAADLQCRMAEFMGSVLKEYGSPITRVRPLGPDDAAADSSINRFSN
jgi:hypothetical protein